MIRIRVGEADFDIATEHQALRQNTDTGAIVTFVGTVRDFDQTRSESFTLQHYPGMTEKYLHTLASAARARFSLDALTLIHRVGELKVQDNIVFVGAASRHRKQAFEAAEYAMDRLKTEAPFWKKEGGKWVEADSKDTLARERWGDDL